MHDSTWTRRLTFTPTMTSFDPNVHLADPLHCCKSPNESAKGLDSRQRRPSLLTSALKPPLMKSFSSAPIILKPHDALNGCLCTYHILVQEYGEVYWQENSRSLCPVRQEQSLLLWQSSSSSLHPSAVLHSDVSRYSQEGACAVASCEEKGNERGRQTTNGSCHRAGSWAPKLYGR